MDDAQQIRDLVETWLRETKAGNVQAVLDLMAPDVVFLVAGQAPMVGRDSFEASLRAVLREHAIETSSTVDEVTVSGDMAYCRTRLEVTIISKHGRTPMRRSGHTLSVFRKMDDGRWLLTRDANMVG